MESMVIAALEAGAHGAFLSGAGPTTIITIVIIIVIITISIMIIMIIINLGPTIMAICSGQSGDIFAQRSTERQEGGVAEAI